MSKRIVGYFALPLLLLLVMPPRGGWALTPPEAFAPGPDVIVGDLPGLVQAGSNGSQVGLAIATDICNDGDVELNFFAMPNTDHPVIPQNLYRMSGGATNDERFEQIGQSWVKHSFFALQQNACGFGCNQGSGGGNHLGVGCSNPDSASLNGSQSGLGSRAWVNPFTGIFPSTANTHTGHTHDGTTHRILVEGADLDTTMNQGATYYAEAQLVTPHEYAWCQGHVGECNMFNNVSYRQFAVVGTTSFTFSPAGAAVRMTPAIFAWPGATIQTIEPEPGVDGRAYIAYKVTQVGAFLWHYEYAIYNENLDRGIRLFSLSAGCGIGMAGNLGFHAPLNHPGAANDGTVGDAGYSNAPWSMILGPNATWSTETFAQNPNANALRWGTLYNFRFDGGPPVTVNGAIGFFKTGAPSTVLVKGPVPECQPSPTPTPFTPPPSPTATATPIATPTPTATSTAAASPSPTPTPRPTITPNPCFITYFTEHFDGVTAPALPSDFVTSFAPGPASCTPNPGTCALGTNWATSNANPFSPPNCAFHDAPGCVTDSNLDTPSFFYNGPTGPSSGAWLSFSHAYDLQEGFDGAVLEISINGGPFTDIVAAGGTFLGGGYNGTISPGTLSPIAGRQAWTGNSGGYLSERVSMPLAAANQNVRFRFRLATDCAGASAGWRIDAINVGYIVPCQSPTPFPSPPGSPTPTPSPPPTTKALNLSTRLRVETGGRVLIGGFIITGGAPKNVAIRGIGPSLAQFGIPGFLADPTLVLRDQSGVLLQQNDNWQDDPEQAAQLTNLGLALQNSNEAGMISSLSPAAYTAVMSWNTGGTGVGLVELYDTNPGANSRLANVSTRGFVQTGDNVMIGGFILGGGGGNTRIVVRGIGPSLTQFGVDPALGDPTLELRDNNGALLIANDDWQSDPVQAAQLSANGFALSQPTESGIFVSLPPGSFTAILAGKNGGNGIGVVEVYNLGAP